MAPKATIAYLSLAPDRSRHPVGAAQKPSLCQIGTGQAIIPGLERGRRWSLPVMDTTNAVDIAGLDHLVTVIQVTRPEVPNERQPGR